MPVLLLTMLFAAPLNPVKPQIAAADIPSLAHDVMAQIRPCYMPPKLPINVVTWLHVHYNADGSLASVPELIDQTTIPEAYRAQADELVMAAKRAAAHCAPLHLPAALYRGGWDDMNLGFATRTGDTR
jgi:hypothetical protein